MGWYGYMAVLAVLMAASAGRRTVLGAAALAAAAASLSLLVMLYRWPVGGFREVSLVLSACVALVGISGLTRARREDTRLIALMLAAAGGLALLFHYRFAS